MRRNNLIRFPLERARALPADRGPAQILVLPCISFDDAIDLVARLISQGHPIINLEPLGAST
mgnify:CR=1 FL=1